MAPSTATTGRTSRYATEPPVSRRRLSRRRRDATVTAAAVSVGSLPLRRALRLVEGLRDVVACDGRGLLDRQAPGEDLGKHRLEDVAVLDVHPVFRLRHEPTARSGSLVDALAEQGGRR